MPEQLKAGDYVLLLQCPECGLTAHMPVELSARYTNDRNGSKLGAVLTAKSKDHACGVDAEQLPLPYLQQR